MVRPLRSEQFRYDEIAIVHCVQRCVRRAFLAGEDDVSGIDYSYQQKVPPKNGTSTEREMGG